MTATRLTTVILLCLLLCSSAATASLAQRRAAPSAPPPARAQTAVTSDGRTVILHADGTWEYAESSDRSEPAGSSFEAEMYKAVWSPEIEKLKGLSAEAKAMTGQAVEHLWRVKRLYELEGGGGKEHYDEMLLSRYYVEKAEAALPDGPFKKLLHACLISMADVYKLKTDTAGLDDLLRIVRTYKLEQTPKYERADTVMKAVTPDVQKLVKVAVEAGLVKSVKN